MSAPTIHPPTGSSALGEALGDTAQGQAPLSEALLTEASLTASAAASERLVGLLLDLNSRLTGGELVTMSLAIMDGWLSGSLRGYMTMGDPAVPIEAQRARLKAHLSELVDQLPAPRFQMGGQHG